MQDDTLALQGSLRGNRWSRLPGGASLAGNKYGPVKIGTLMVGCQQGSAVEHDAGAKPCQVSQIMLSPGKLGGMEPPSPASRYELLKFLGHVGCVSRQILFYLRSAVPAFPECRGLERLLGKTDFLLSNPSASSCLCAWWSTFHPP